jgi:hypothetical protein
MLLSMETLRSSPCSPSEPFGRKQQFFMQNTTARRRNRSPTAIRVITMTLPCWPKGSIRSDALADKDLLTQVVRHKETTWAR